MCPLNWKSISKLNYSSWTPWEISVKLYSMKEHYIRICSYNLFCCWIIKKGDKMAFDRYSRVLINKKVYFVDKIGKKLDQKEYVRDTCFWDIFVLCIKSLSQRKACKILNFVRKQGFFFHKWNGITERPSFKTSKMAELQALNTFTPFNFFFIFSHFL